MKKRREQIWCEAEWNHSYFHKGGALREVGANGREVGTFVVTAHWKAHVRGEGMVAITATLPGDDREWRGRFSPSGGGAGYGNRVVIRPTKKRATKPETTHQETTMTTSTYAIVHIPDNTPELPMTALGAHVTIRTQETEQDAMHYLVWHYVGRPSDDWYSRGFPSKSKAIDHARSLRDEGITPCYVGSGPLGGPYTYLDQDEWNPRDIDPDPPRDHPDDCDCDDCGYENHDAHVTVRIPESGYIASLSNCPDCGTMNPPDDCDLVPCTGGCGELVPDTIEGDPYCEDCAFALVPEDVRAMGAAPSGLARDIAALPDAHYTVFWERLLHEYLADPPATDLDIDALQDAIQDFAYDRSPTTCTPLSLAPTGPAAHPTRLAG